MIRLGNRYGDLNAEHPGAEADTFTAERYQQFVRLLPPATADILDVGCSTGRGGTVLKGAFPASRIVGLDCVESRIQRLPEAYQGGVVGSSTDLEMPDRSFDAIVAGEFIEHLSPSDVAVTLEEFARVLRPGGALLMTTPNPKYWRLRLTGRSVLGGAHLSEHDPTDLAAAVEAAGFRNVEIHPSGKVTRVLGFGFPLGMYGSYLASARGSAEA